MTAHSLCNQQGDFMLWWPAEVSAAKYFTVIMLMHGYAVC